MEVIQMLWIGEKLSKIEILSLVSFIKNGHEVHLYCYDEVKNIPYGVKIMDACKIVARKEVFKAHGGSYGAFSDLFRHTLLYKVGGCWVDTDVVCLKPFIFDDLYGLCLEDVNKISTAVLNLPKGNFISERIIRNFDKPWELMKIDNSEVFDLKEKYKEDYKKELYKKSDWGELGGPVAVTNIYKRYKLDIETIAPETFYPIHWSEWKRIFYDKDFLKNTNLNDTYGIHLWNNMFKTDPNFNKNKCFEEGTLINSLYKRFDSEM